MPNNRGFLGTAFGYEVIPRRVTERVLDHAVESKSLKIVYMDLIT